MKPKTIRRRKFSQKEVDYVKSNWYDKELVEIGKHIGRHPMVVKKMGKRLGLLSKMEMVSKRRSDILLYIKHKYGITKVFDEYPRKIVNKISKKFDIGRRTAEIDMIKLGFKWINKYQKMRESSDYIVDNWEKINIKTMAKKLGLSRATIWRYCKELSLTPKNRKGPNSGKWKGGCCNTNKRKMNAIRKSVMGYRWENDVKIRDGIKCKKCGELGGRNKYYNIVGVTAHHIYNFYDYPKKRFDIKNGVTLCIKCHEKFHDKYGYRYTNKNQLTRFLKHV